LQSKREVRYTGADESGLAVSEVIDDNWRERIQHEAYWTLQDVGNLERNGKPVFPKMPANIMKWEEFTSIWGKLHPLVAQTIHRAVRQFNPDWDWQQAK